MKRSFLWVVSAALLILLGSVGVGCGGGSGGSTSSNGNNDAGNTGGVYTNVRVSATLQGSGNFGVDTSDLAVGDTVRLRLLGVNSNGQTVSLNGSQWTTNAPSSVATVTADGILTAVGSSNGTNYTVSTTGPGGTVSSVLNIRAPLAFVTGRIRNINGTGVGSVRIQFVTAGGAFLAQTSSAPDGTFRGNVPANAAKFTIDIETADASSNPIYYRQFDYTPPGHSEPLSYVIGQSGCYASLPDLTVGSTVSIGDIVLADRASGPPPPPTGCLNG